MICPRCGEENPGRARFCLNCGAPLQASTAPRPEVRKTVTVVFSDISGSTELGERVDPESLRHVLSRYFDRMRTVLTRHGGTVEKFIGDAVMAVFGIPELHEDDALRAVRAALEIRDALAELNHELEQAWGVQLQVHTGVNTGEVVAGDPSVAQTLVTGDAVNVAARLEQAASPGEILLGPVTHRMVRDAVKVEAVGPLSLKGKDRPLEAFRLLEVRPGALGHARNPAARLVGREQERRLIDWAFSRVVREGTCHLFTVLGPAGAGKSRLIAEAVSSVGDAKVIGGECPPYGESVAFWPLAKAVRQVLDVSEAAPADEALAALTRHLDGHPDAEVVVARLAGLLGSRGPEVAVDDLAWAARKLFESFARRQPLVAVFDDLHWAESTFLDLVDHIADWSRGAPILLLCAARPELLEARPTWGGGKLNATSIHLEPLTEPESAELLEHLLSQGELADNVRAWITEAAEGNPLFIEEMLAMLLDEGLLWWDGTQWVPTVDIRKLAMPPTIQALLASRLDRLRPPAAAAMQRAAVIGKVFDLESLAALSPLAEREQLATTLMGLARKDLIRTESDSAHGDGYRFRHLLVRDAAYESLPKAERAGLHERLAQWYLAHGGPDVDELVGHHYEAAYRYLTALGPEDARARDLAVRAAAQLASAGERALARDDAAAASNLLARASLLTRPGDAGHPQMLLAYGTALSGLGSLATADGLLARAIDAAGAEGDERIAAHAMLARLEVRLHTDPSDALAVASREVPPIIDMLEQIGDEGGLSRAWALMGSVYWTRCFVARSEESAERALQHARAAGDAAGRAQILALALVCAMYGPRPVGEGLARAEAVLADAGGNQALRARALRAIAVLRAMQGGFDEGRRLVAEVARLAEDLGQVLYVAGAHQVLGIIELMAGDMAAAERALRASTDLLVRQGDRSYMSTSAALLAHAVHGLGDLDEAERLTRMAAEASAPQDLDTQTTWRAARAKVLADRGLMAEAAALADEAVALGQDTDLTTYADVMIDAATVLAQAGRVEDATALVDEALARYEAKGNVAGAAAARARRDALRSLADATAGRAGR